jgi:hypothetical protein
VIGVLDIPLAIPSLTTMARVSSLFQISTYPSGLVSARSGPKMVSSNEVDTRIGGAIPPANCD